MPSHKGGYYRRFRKHTNGKPFRVEVWTVESDYADGQDPEFVFSLHRASAADCRELVENCQEGIHDE